MTNYVALYREWRPTRFADVIGQEHVTRTLRNALQQGRLGHAYLFAGPRGTGKTSVAKILAVAANCLKLEDGEPCGRCEACQKIKAGQTMDVLEIDAASNRGIDEIRDLRERTRFAPSGIKCKVYIIDEVHMLTDYAFNALLKTLEEPPPSILFILATTEVHKIPATILSRCQRFDFHRIDQGRIMERLRQVCAQQKVRFTEPAIYQIARHADGGLRDALSLLDQCISFAEDELNEQVVSDLLGLTLEADLLDWMHSLLRGDVGDILAVINRIHSSGRDLRQAVSDVMGVCRDLILLRADSDAAKNQLAWTDEAVQRLYRVAAESDVETLLRWLHRLAEAERDMRRSTLPRVVLEMHLLEQVQQELEQGREQQAAAAAVAATGTVTPVSQAMPASRVSFETAPSSRETSAASSEQIAHLPQVLPRASTEQAAEAARTATRVSSDPPSIKLDVQGENKGQTGTIPVQDGDQPGAIDELWPALLQEVKKGSPVARALLESAKHRELRGDRLVIFMPSKYLIERMQDAKTAQLVTSSLAKVTDRSITIDYRLWEEQNNKQQFDNKRSVAVSGEQGKGNIPASIDPRVQEMIDFFGGKIVQERSHDGKGEEF